MSTVTRAIKKVVEMKLPEPEQDAEHQESVSAYAPQRAREPYLTDAMIAPSGNVNLGDPVRLAQITGPAIDQIGKSTADKIDLVALSIVENARHGAETILAEAKVQADDMVQNAETLAAEMRVFAESIRTYTDRKAQQVSSFCAVAESVLGTMHGLGDQFQHMTIEEARAEKALQESPPVIPSFLARAKK